MTTNHKVEKYIQHLASQSPTYSYTEKQPVDKPTIQSSLKDKTKKEQVVYPTIAYTEPQKIDKPTIQKSLEDEEEWEHEENVNEFVVPVIAGVLAASLITTAYLKYKKNFVKNAEECIDVPKNWDTQEKNICILRHEIQFRKEQIMSLLNSKQTCLSKLKDKSRAKSCAGRIEKEIDRIKSKLPDLEKRLARIKLIGWD